MKTKLTLLLLLFTTPFLTNCQSMPPTPKGSLCVFDATRLESECVVMSAKMIKQDSEGKLSFHILAAGPRVGVAASSMNNWITTDPDSWAEIQTYINRLKALAQKYVSQPIAP